MTALLFDPVRKWIQEHIDQFFYRTRYDYRRTLIEFGRELSAETDLEQNARLSRDRLARTLLVDRLAIFVAGTIQSAVSLAKSFGISQTCGLDLEFPATYRGRKMEAGHLFFENTHLVPRESAGAQQTIAKLDLNYYIPCRAQQRTIAFLGLGQDCGRRFSFQRRRGAAGNARRLHRNRHPECAPVRFSGAKDFRYERLKDFNENIVESINVGVLAVDLEDRVESWNSQMEVMYALPAWQALRRSTE